MTIDEHNACPTCAQQVRVAFEAAMTLVILLENRTDPLGPGELGALANAHAALWELAPLVRAHHANQLHAFSAKLASARHPRLAPEEGDARG